MRTRRPQVKTVGARGSSISISAGSLTPGCALSISAQQVVRQVGPFLAGAPKKRGRARNPGVKRVRAAAVKREAGTTSAAAGLWPLAEVQRPGAKKARVARDVGAASPLLQPMRQSAAAPARLPHGGKELHRKSAGRLKPDAVFFLLNSRTDFGFIFLARCVFETALSARLRNIREPQLILQADQKQRRCFFFSSKGGGLAHRAAALPP